MAADRQLIPPVAKWIVDPIGRSEANHQLLVGIGSRVIQRTADREHAGHLRRCDPVSATSLPAKGAQEIPKGTGCNILVAAVMDIAPGSTLTG